MVVGVTALHTEVGLWRREVTGVDEARWLARAAGGEADSGCVGYVPVRDFLALVACALREIGPGRN
jgi:hypothetical protein